MVRRASHGHQDPLVTTLRSSERSNLEDMSPPHGGALTRRQGLRDGGRI